MKSQINEFIIELSKKETIIYHILNYFNKKDEYLQYFEFKNLSKQVLFGYTIIIIIHSLIISIFLSFFFIILYVLCFIKCKLSYIY